VAHLNYTDTQTSSAAPRSAKFGHFGAVYELSKYFQEYINYRFGLALLDGSYKVIHLPAKFRLKSINKHTYVNTKTFSTKIIAN